MQTDVVIFLLLFTPVSLFLASFLFVVGRYLTQMTDFSTTYATYKKERHSYTTTKRIFVDLFMVFTALDRSVAVKWFGNDFVTKWYRASGYLFYVFGALFLLGLLLVWLGVLGVFDRL